MTAKAWGRRIATASLLAAILVVPGAIVGLVAGSRAAVGMIAGTVLTLGILSSTDRRGARIAGGALLLAAVLGPLTAGSPAWVAVVALLAAAAGAAARFGATAAVSYAALLAVVAPAAEGPEQAVGFAAFVALGGAYSVVVQRRRDASSGSGAAVPPIEPRPAAASAVLAVLSAASVGAAAALALALGGPRAAWVPMTVLIVLGPVATGHSQRNRERVVGTLVGAIVATAIGLASPPSWLLGALVVIALVAVLATAGLRYRTQVAWITILVLLGSAPADQVANLAVERAGLTLLAAVLVAIGLPMARLALRAVATPDTDPAAAD